VARLRLDVGRTEHTPPEFCEASAKVAYELGMVAHTARALHYYRVPESPSLECQLIYNALIHSFLLGIRNLYEFLWGGQSDGIHAKAFVEPGKWTAKRPKFRKGEHWKPMNHTGNPVDGQDLIKLIQTRLAHLSWKRVSEGKVAWFVLPIAAEFVAPLSTFVSQVAADRLSPDLCTAVQELADFVCSIELSAKKSR